MARTDSQKRGACLVRLTGLVLLWGMPATALLAQADGDPVVCGTYRTLHSTLLAEDRTLFVGLPADYEKSGRSYPVLYRLDGSPVIFLHTISSTRYLVDMREAESDYIGEGGR